MQYFCNHPVTKAKRKSCTSIKLQKKITMSVTRAPAETTSYTISTDSICEIKTTTKTTVTTVVVSELRTETTTTTTTIVDVLRKIKIPFTDESEFLEGCKFHYAWLKKWEHCSDFDYSRSIYGICGIRVESLLIKWLEMKIPEMRKSVHCFFCMGAVHYIEGRGSYRSPCSGIMPCS